MVGDLKLEDDGYGGREIIEEGRRSLHMQLTRL
jgi:hypothetical protein